MRSQWLTAYLATITLAAAGLFAALGNVDLAQVLVGAGVGVIGGAAAERTGAPTPPMLDRG